MKKSLVECKAVGVPLPEEVARHIDEVARNLPKECTYRKAATVPESVELVSGERADISVITTDAVDRDWEVVLPKGLDLEQYQRNPVVTFAHDWDGLPVGRAQWVKRIGNGLRAKTVYATKPEGWQGDWFADAVYSLVQQQMLPGKSIGFLPTSIRPPSQEEIKQRPDWKDASLIIETAILLEYSIAPVPSNPDAVVEAVQKGLTSPLILERLGIKVPKPQPKVITKSNPLPQPKCVLPDVDFEALVMQKLKQKLKGVDPAEVIRKAMANVKNGGRV